MRPKILVTSSDPITLETLASQLDPGGIDVVLARDGSEALHQVASHPDLCLVLIDQDLSWLSGRELVNELAKQWPQLPTLLMGETKPTFRDVLKRLAQAPKVASRRP